MEVDWWLGWRMWGGDWAVAAQLQAAERKGKRHEFCAQAATPGSLDQPGVLPHCLPARLPTHLPAMPFA